MYPYNDVLQDNHHRESIDDVFSWPKLERIPNANNMPNITTQNRFQINVTNRATYRLSVARYSTEQNINVNITFDISRTLFNLNTNYKDRCISSSPTCVIPIPAFTSSVVVFHERDISTNRYKRTRASYQCEFRSDILVIMIILLPFTVLITFVLLFWYQRHVELLRYASPICASERQS